MGRAALDYLPHYTLEDYDRWEGDWELIDGVPFAMAPSPLPRHQRMGHILMMEMEPQLEVCPDCRLYYELDWRAATDTVLRPHLLVVCGPIDEDQPLTITPSLVVEMVSPSSKAYDRELKSMMYARFGVNYYVLAEPKTGHVEAFRWTKGGYKLLTGSPYTLALSKDCRIQLPETIEM